MVWPFLVGCVANFGNACGDLMPIAGKPSPARRSRMDLSANEVYRGRLMKPRERLYGAQKNFAYFSENDKKSELFSRKCAIISMLTHSWWNWIPSQPPTLLVRVRAPTGVPKKPRSNCLRPRFFVFFVRRRHLLAAFLFLHGKIMLFFGARGQKEWRKSARPCYNGFMRVISGPVGGGAACKIGP